MKPMKHYYTDRGGKVYIQTEDDIREDEREDAGTGVIGWVGIILFGIGLAVYVWVGA